MARLLNVVGFLARVVLGFAGLVLGAGLGYGQTEARPPADRPEGLAIVRVEFDGLEMLSEQFCRSKVLSVAGQPYGEARVTEDVRRLIRTGRFLDVQAAWSEDQGGVVLTFRVRERPMVGAIEFVGNVKFSDRALLKELDLKPGDPLDRFAVRHGATLIRQKYRQAGYGEAQVSFDPELLRRENRIVFTIEEGPRVRIRSIRLEGRSSFSNRELMAKVSSATYIPFLRTGALDPDQLERDAAELQNHYRDRGFLDAHVGYRTESLETEGDMAVVFLIEEGTQYTIDSLDFEGNTVFDHEELAAIIRLQPGAVMRQDLLLEDLEALKTQYGESGYLYTVIAPRRAFTEQPGRVVLEFEIREGSAYSVGRIVVRGNQQTQDKVIRRELEFYPDELFSTTKLKRSEQNVRGSGLFQNVRITPVGDAAGVRDVVVDVVEREQISNLIIGGGVGSNSGLAGMLSFEVRNFDLADWPRTWGEFFRGRAFRGAGQYFRLRMSPGSEVSSFRIDWRDPYFLDRPLRLGTSFYLFERGRAEYAERRTGALFSLGKPFEEGFLKGWSGEVSLRLEDTEIDDLHFFPADDIADAEGHHLLIGAKIGLVRNRTDSRFFPTRGDVWSFSYEQVVGDHTFAKLRGAYTWYKTLGRDDLNRPHVLALKADGGYIVGDAPVFERFHAGGIGSLRGFAFRGISPRDGPFFDDDQRIGGDFRLFTAVEYSFPLFAKAIRGVLFSDMGTVEEDLEINFWRASVGFGVRIYVEQLGPIPFEFNLAFPVASDPEDDEQAFSFAIGITF